MFIKSEKQKSAINLKRVCSIQKDGYDIMFYYSKIYENNDFDYWRYDSESARDEAFETILRKLPSPIAI